MANDKLLDDLESNLREIRSLVLWLDKVYYNSEFASVLNKPIISFLIQAANFIIVNLEKQGDIYRKKKGLE